MTDKSTEQLKELASGLTLTFGKLSRGPKSSNKGMQGKVKPNTKHFPSCKRCGRSYQGIKLKNGLCQKCREYDQEQEAEKQMDQMMGGDD